MKVLTCVQFDARGRCIETAWVELTPFGLPPLTGEEGAQLGAAVVGLFAVAWLLRLLRKKAG